MPYVLFPPLMDTYTPSFPAGQTARIYFRISNFNKPDDIKEIHVSVRELKSNLQQYNDKSYNGFILKDFSNENKTEDNRYYIDLSNSDIMFNPMKYYKVQIRFSSVKFSEVQNSETGSMTFSGFLENNKSNFSEWSTITLVHSFTRLEDFFSLNGEYNKLQPVNIIRDNVESFESNTLIDINAIDLYGKVNFQKEEKEYLDSYEVRVLTGKYETEEDVLKHFTEKDYYSDIVYPNELNEINYTLGFQYVDDEDYTLMITIYSNNRYTESFIYNYTTTFVPIFALKGDFSAYMDNDFARVVLDFDTAGAINDNLLSTITIRRSDSRDNFEKWTDIYNYQLKNLNLNDGTIKIKFYDYNIEDGVFYQYSICQRDRKGRRGEAKTAVWKNNDLTDKGICYMEDIFLVGKNQRQLRIRYNPQISTFKRNVADAKIETLGSKYAFFKRNAKMDYKEFPITGTITFLSDINTYTMNPYYSYLDSIKSEEQELKDFTEDEKKEDKNYLPLEEQINIQNKLYHDYAFSANSPEGGNKFDALLDGRTTDYRTYYYEDYKEYKDYNVTDVKDYIQEREFRKKVMDFLLDGQVKLFKSATEGTILVRLMNISFTPRKDLNRQIYDFSATAYEVDDWNIENVDKYDIQNIGDYSREKLYLSSEYIGQYMSMNDIGEPLSQNDVFSLIKNRIDETKKPGKKYTMINESIRWLKIEFNSEPYLVNIKDLSNRPKRDGEITSERGMQNYEYGFLIEINGEKIFIPRERSFYEVSTEKDIYITSFNVIYPLNYQCKLTVDYIFKCSWLSTTRDINTVTITKKIGQVNDNFIYGYDVCDRIKGRYFYKEKDVEEHVSIIDKLSIETEPNTVFSVKEDGKEMYFMMNDTGFLRLFSQDDNGITSLKIYGQIKKIPGSEYKKYRDNLNCSLFTTDRMKLESLDRSLEGSAVPSYFWITDREAYKYSTAMIDYHCKVIRYEYESQGED